jgi:hypothetical protein
MLEKFNAYLNAAFVRHTADYETSLWARHASKWWLDFFRNIVVVSTVYYLAEKSGNTVLKFFSYAYYGVLIAFVGSHFNTWSFRFFPYIKNPKTNIWINGLIWIVLYTVVTTGCYIALATVFKSLSLLQTK